jgi:hypothetical protein
MALEEQPLQEGLEDDNAEENEVFRNRRGSNNKKGQRRNIVVNSEGGHLSADKVKYSKNVSPYSIKTLSKFPTSNSASKGVQERNSSKKSTAAAGHTHHPQLMQQLMAPLQLESTVLQPEQSSLNRSSAANHTNFTNFKSTTSIQLVDGVKQHLPPLDPKGNVIETPSNSQLKKSMIKNAFTEEVNVKKVNAD